MCDEGGQIVDASFDHGPAVKFRVVLRDVCESVAGRVLILLLEVLLIELSEELLLLAFLLLLELCRALILSLELLHDDLRGGARPLIV